MTSDTDLFDPGRDEFVRILALLGVPREGAPFDRPFERRRFLERLGLSRALLATAAAQDRVRLWAASGGLLEPDTPEARRALIGRIAILGDGTLLSAVEATLLKLPLVVLDHLRRNAVLYPAGRASAGFDVREPAREPDASEVRHSLVMTYCPPGRASWLRRVAHRLRLVHEPDAVAAAVADYQGLVAHEIAHAFLVPPLHETGTTAANVESYERYIGFAVDYGLLDRVIRPAEKGEHQACALAEAWGFASVPAELCAWNARRSVLSAAQRVRPPSS